MDIEILKQGIYMAITGYLIVFAALAFFFGAFYFLPRALKFRLKTKFRKQNKSECVQKMDEEITAGTLAAISVAIYLYLKVQHDEESYNLTIKKISRRYSPWSSKIYSMNNLNKIR